MTKHDETEKDERETLYEIGYLVVPTVASEQLPSLVEELHKVLADHGAEIKHEGAPFLRDLAYEIAKVSVGRRQKFTSAYFGFIVFTADSASAAGIKKALDAHEKILRFLLIKTDNETAAPVIPLGVEGDETVPMVPEQPKASEEEIDKKIDTLVAM